MTEEFSNEKENQKYGVCDEKYSELRGQNSELTWRYKYRATVAVDIISQLDFKSPKILDMGCADGLTMLEMKNQLPSSDFYGVELSENLVNIAQEKKIKVFQGDVCSLSKIFQDNIFDVVIAMAVLEHLPNPVLAGKEAFRVLKPGGILIATCPNPNWELISKKVGIFKEGGHCSHFDKKKFQGFAEQCGFEIKEYKRFMSAFLGVMPYLKILLPIKTTLKVDQIIHSIGILDWCFVNQVVVLKKCLS